jgi:apolipoprotein N-acyltransferase
METTSSFSKELLKHYWNSQLGLPLTTFIILAVAVFSNDFLNKEVGELTKWFLVMVLAVMLILHIMQDFGGELHKRLVANQDKIIKNQDDKIKLLEEMAVSYERTIVLYKEAINNMEKKECNTP